MRQRSALIPGALFFATDSGVSSVGIVPQESAARPCYGSEFHLKAGNKSNEMPWEDAIPLLVRKLLFQAGSSLEGEQRWITKSSTEPSQVFRQEEAFLESALH
jgi:hypothetical protein